MKISVIGTGYVGLVTAAGLAEMGHEIVGVDRDESLLGRLSSGKIHIYEPGLEDLLKKNIAAGRVTFTSDISAAIRGSEVVFVCVGTPTRPDGHSDLSQVEEVARTIAESFDDPERKILVVEKSTVPVKTAYWIRRTIGLFSNGSDRFEVASNPEFLREGSAVADFMNPDRIVIGVDSPWAQQQLESLYSGMIDKVVVTDVGTAEIIKHASNSFLAMKISFINMVADLCEKTGADVKMVSKGMGLDHRIGEGFLSAGLGYGGSCFPKDVQAFVNIAKSHGVDFSLLDEVMKINDARVDRLIEKLNRALWVPKGKQIALLGLAFKPDTDDIRCAPSIKLITRLLQEGAYVRLYDPQAAERMKEVFPEGKQVSYHATPYEALKGAHAGVLVTEWPELTALDFAKARKVMSVPMIIDGRNSLDPLAARKAGFEYYGMGRENEVE